MKKLTEKAKNDIFKAFENYGGSGIPEPHLINLLAQHAIGLLELDNEITSSWYESDDAGSDMFGRWIDSYGETFQVVPGITADEVLVVPNDHTKRSNGWLISDAREYIKNGFWVRAK